METEYSEPFDLERFIAGEPAFSLAFGPCKRDFIRVEYRKLLVAHYYGKDREDYFYSLDELPWNEWKMKPQTFKCEDFLQDITDNSVREVFIPLPSLRDSAKIASLHQPETREIEVPRDEYDVLSGQK